MDVATNEAELSAHSLCGKGRLGCGAATLAEISLFIREWAALLRRHRDTARAAIAGLRQEALDWHSEALRNSLGVLASHIAGSERYWIGDILLEESSDRDRAAELRTRDATEAQLAARLDSSGCYTESVLSRLSKLDLAATKPVKNREDPPDLSIGWVLMHVLEHTAYHAGQMHMLRRAWLDARTR